MILVQGIVICRKRQYRPAIGKIHGRRREVGDTDGEKVGSSGV